MNTLTPLMEWFFVSLFWLGVLMLAIGVIFLIAPGWALSIGNKLNRWVSTKFFFDSIDKPRYQERWIYRHYRISGIIIVVVTCYVFYVFLMAIGIDVMVGKLIGFADSGFYKWLYEQLFYIFLGANVIALVLGLIILIRPSLLKAIEEKSNRWIGTNEKLDKLDRSISTDIYLGNPRLFGFAVVVGGIYIIISSALMLL